MRILYLHPSKTYGGASKSLIELYLAARKHAHIEAWVLTPRGSASEAFKEAGMNVIETYGLAQFDHTRFGHYRNLRWLILLRELFLTPISLYSLLCIKKLNISFDLIHINEITLLPSALLAKWIFKLPLVFHVRSLQCEGTGELRTKIIFRILRRYSSALICIDETVRATIPQSITSVVIHNGINLDSVPIKKDRSESFEISVGMAGVLHRSKGVYEFLQAARILLKDRRLNVHFVLAGENAREARGLRKWLYDKLGYSEDVYANLHRYVEENEISQHVFFTGLIKDIRQFYPTLDVLCFPSHLNACGRPVFEAAFYGVPSIVAIKKPREDAIVDGVTGIVIDEPYPELLANAIEKFVYDHQAILSMGCNARVWAQKFYNINNNSRLLLDLYSTIINKHKNIL